MCIHIHVYVCTFIYSRCTFTIYICMLTYDHVFCLLCVGICYIQWIVKERPYLCHGQSEFWKYVLYAQCKCVPYAMGIPYAVCMPHVYSMLWIAIR